MRRHTLLAGLVAGALLPVVSGLLTATAAQATSLPKVTIAVTKTTASVSGSLESGAVDITSTDQGAKEAAVILFHLNAGATLSEVEAFAKSSKVKDPNYASAYGSIVWDVEDNPGATSEAQTYLQPGEYVVLSTVGESPAKIRTHFTVTASAAPAALPKPAATESTIEFAFRGPTTLTDGELVRFENEGFLVHMDVAFPTKSMSTAKTIVKALLTGKEKGLEKLVTGPPVTFFGPASSGAFQQETITAKPGIYVQACFMDTQDGRSHTELGMERIIKITK